MTRPAGPRRASDRALALAADDLEGDVLPPVHEQVHVLEAELRGHREVLDALLEGAGADAGGEGVELLAVLALRLVEADPALDGVGDALGRQAHLQARAVDHLAALVVAADVRDRGRDRLAADLD